MEKWMNQGTTLCYRDVEKDIMYCHKYGFDAIELKYNVVKNYDLDRLKGQLEEHHVRAGVLGALELPVFGSSNEKLQMESKFEDMCRIAAKIGCNYITIVPPRVKAEKKLKEVDAEIISLLRTYLHMGEIHGLKLAFEVTGFDDSLVNTFQNGLMFIRKLASENIGLILDLYHFFGGNMQKEELLQAKADEIFIVHMNDGKKNRNGKYLDDDRMWPGDGEFDIDDLMQILKNMRYNGPISLEVYQQTQWKFDMETCYKTARLKLDASVN